MEQQSEQNKIEQPQVRSHGPDDAIYLLAYRKWTETNPICKCTEHGTKLDKPDCERQIYWYIYCKARDSKPLTANEIFLIGGN